MTAKDRVHPTEKPLPLMAYLVRYITPKCGTVLDPCMGSAAAGEACLRSGFGYIGAELDPKYFRSACNPERECL